MADTSNLSQFLTDVADAIKNKKGTTAKIPAADFDTEITSIETGIDTTDATATPNDLINPKTAYVGGQKITGSMLPTYEEASAVLSTYLVAQGGTGTGGVTSDGKAIVLWKNNIIYTYVFNETMSTYDLKNQYTQTTLGMNSNSGTTYAMDISEYIENKVCRVAFSNGNQSLVCVTFNADTGEMLYTADGKYSAKLNWPGQYANSHPWKNYIEPVFSLVFNRRNPRVLYISYNNGFGTLFTTSNVINDTAWSFGADIGLGQCYDLRMSNDNLYLLGNNKLVVLSSDGLSATSTYPFGTNANISTDITLAVSDAKLYKVTRNTEGNPVLSDVISTDVSIAEGLGVWLSQKMYAVVKDSTLYVYDFTDTENITTQTFTQDTLLYRHPGTGLSLHSVSENMLLKISVEEKLVSLQTNQGTLYSTTDATITTDDVISGKVAYGSNGKVIGTGTSGVDTSDATATSNDIINPKTAYVNGRKLTGAIEATYRDASAQEFMSSETVDTTLKYVGGNYFVKMTSATIYVLKLEGTVLNLITSYALSDLSSYNSTSYTRGDCSIYSSENNDIRFIIPAANGNGTIYYLRFDANTNAISLVTSATPCTPMYSTAVHAKFPNHTNNYFMFWSEQCNYGGIDKQIVLSYTVNSTSMSMKSALFNSKFYGNTASNVHFAHNDNLFCLTRTTKVDDQSSIKQYQYVLNDTFDVLSTNYSTYDYRNMIISDNGNYGYLGEDIYSISYTDSNVPVIGDIAVTTTETIQGLFALDYVETTTSVTNKIYKINENSVLEEKISTNNSLVTNRDYRGIIQIVSGTKGLLIENLSTLSEKVITKMVRDTISYYDSTDANALTDDIVSGKIAYTSTGKIIGAMKNNGVLNYEPSEETQIIPKGYTDGGTISAISYDDTLTPTEYIQALSLTQNILGVQEYVDVDLFDNGIFETINTMVFTSLGGATTGSMTIGTTINTTQAGSGGSGAEYKLVTDVPVDFTKVTKLIITFTTAYTGNKGRFNIAIPTNPDSITGYNDTVPDTVLTVDSYSGTAEIDVSSYTGERYIFFRIGSGTYGDVRTLSISKIQILEEVL